MTTSTSLTTESEIIETPAAAAVRSPADVLRAVVALGALLALVLIELLFGDAVIDFAQDLLRGLDALSADAATAITVAVRVLAVIFLVGGLVVAVARGRFRLLLTAAVAAIAGAGLSLLVDMAAPDAGKVVTAVNDVVGPLSDRDFPSAEALAAVIAIVTASAPWLGRNMRRVGWVLVWGLLLARFLHAPVHFDTASAALCGWFAGALVVVAFGAPPRRPTGRAIAEGLARVDVPLARLEQASVDARGSTPYFGEAADGRKLFVKALGDDERSADLLFRMYRRMQPHDFGDEKAFSSLRRAVEHEALVALSAASIGIRTPAIVAFTSAEPNGFVLAYEAIDGRSLDRVAPEELDDSVLDSIWEQMTILRRHRIAHRDLRLANVFLASDGTPWIIDFGFSELAASDLLLATDLAELLASSALQVGAERAVVRGSAAIGAEALATASERLRPSTLSGATRTAYKERPGALDDLRALIT